MGQYTNQDCLTEIKKISTVKANIRNAIIEKGVEVPADTVFADYSEKIADISGGKPEETLTQTITENGTQTFTPTAGSVFDSAVITVNVPGITPTGTINISANGTYDVTDKATAVVAVGGTDYRYKNGTPDTIGLAAIGWTADDIGYYGANAPHYAWENDNYKVSQKNIDLYSLDDPQSSLYRDDPEVTFVPNKNILKYFGPGSGNTGFNSMPYIKSIPLFNTSAITSLNYWFSNCTSLQVIPPLDTSSVTNMSYMFKNCNSLQVIPPLNTSSVTDMEEMFFSCYSLQTIPPLNTSGVKNMKSMFRFCSSLTSIPPLDTSSVTNMGYMFNGCSSLTSIPPLDTSSVTDMSYMFQGCSKLTSIPLLDTSKVIYSGGLFKDCTRLKSVAFDQSSLAKNVSGTVGYYSMFSGCSDLERVKFTGSTPTTGGNLVQYMFYDCNNLQSVEGVDFSKVPDNLNYLFGFTSKLPKLTRFIVIGKINASSTDSYGFSAAVNLDYDSIKSILEAMNRTDNTSAKTMKFNCVIVDRDGELAGLVSSCSTKGWTIQGLTIKEQSVINSITPSKEHLTSSDFGYGSGLVFTVNANKAWSGAGYPGDHQSSTVTLGVQIDYYDTSTDEKVRTGSSSSSNYWTVASGDTGETQTSPEFWKNSYYMPSPQSGEYALVGISFRDNVTPYEFVDYYFKVYPDGE